MSNMQETFCYWRYPSHQLSKAFICGGRLFAGHVGNCPYLNLHDARIHCKAVEPRPVTRKQQYLPVPSVVTVKCLEISPKCIRYLKPKSGEEVYEVD